MAIVTFVNFINQTNSEKEQQTQSSIANYAIQTKAFRMSQLPQLNPTRSARIKACVS
jgi:hypothetical protein